VELHAVDDVRDRAEIGTVEHQDPACGSDVSSSTEARHPARWVSFLFPPVEPGTRALRYAGMAAALLALAGWIVLWREVRLNLEIESPFFMQMAIHLLAVLACIRGLGVITVLLAACALPFSFLLSATVVWAVIPAGDLGFAFAGIALLAGRFVRHG
jgi:hypothetical protein